VLSESLVSGNDDSGTEKARRP